MDTKEIMKKVGHGPHKKVKLAVSDLDGILRGKVIHEKKFQSIVESGFGFCDVVFAWDCADQLYDNVSFSGWHTGYPDAKAKIDLQTFREIPWENDLPFFLADFYEDNEFTESLPLCPRGLVKKSKKKAAQLGFDAFFSQEFEWFNFSESPEELHQKDFRNPNPLTPGMFGYSLLRASKNSAYFNDLFDLLEKFRVPLEGLHTETGPGVYEAAILYDDILEAGDRAILFKTAVKEIAQRHNIIPSFMAKWSSTLPGCSGHLHQSLWDKKSHKNLFYNEKDSSKLSPMMESYMAGVLHCLPDLLPFYAPTINSYKRLVEGAWAPTTLTWGIDNRTTSLRALPGSQKSSRIELRVVGSDTNPYLSMAASLLSGLYGIENNLKLKAPQTVGNGYTEKGQGSLSKNLLEATTKMENSKISNELFGEVFIKHFSDTRKWEWREFQKAVTDWELKRYFEII